MRFLVSYFQKKAFVGFSSETWKLIEKMFLQTVSKLQNIDKIDNMQVPFLYLLKVKK